MNARKHRLRKGVGPFSDNVRPFTVNHAQTLCFVNVNKLLGFEVGDLTSGQTEATMSFGSLGFREGTYTCFCSVSNGVTRTKMQLPIYLRTSESAGNVSATPYFLDEAVRVLESSGGGTESPTLHSTGTQSSDAPASGNSVPS